MKTFDEFYAKLSDVVNSYLYLGKRISQCDVVRKFFRSLPIRFQSKITAIEESKNMDEIKVKQLVKNLQTFEANLCVKNKKPKGIALKSSKNDSEDDLELDPDMMTMLVKNFKKF